MGLTDSKNRTGQYCWFVPATLLILAGISILFEWRVVALVAFAAFPPSLYSCYLYDHLVRARLAEQRHSEAMAELHLQTIEALALAIDAKDATTHEHLDRVVGYAQAIGAEMGLTDDELKALRAAALLHDIGKLAVPEHIISKPGQLTQEEFEKVKIHTIVGAQILEQVKFPFPVAPMVRAHHERWDGSGYPDGLKGEEIPIGARILAVADSFDALSSDRQYRRALPLSEALTVVKREAGVLYDPRVIEVLEKLFPRFSSLLDSCSRSETRVCTDLKVEKGRAPKAGLSIEKVNDTSSALYSISQAREELQVLYELTQALGTSLNLDGTLRLLADQLRRLIPFDAVAIYLLHEGKLVPRFVEGANAPLLARMDIPLGKGLSGWVAGNGRCSLNGNPAVEPGYQQDPVQFGRLRSALSVPLDSSNGTIGALTLYSTCYKAFTVDHLRVLKTVGTKAGSTIHNAMIHEAIGKSAETDALTGLLNARALWARVQQESARATREAKTFSLFVLDMNGLKHINDTRGHLVGNKALQAVAGALRSCLREYDLAARMGGDEFVLLLPGLGSEDAALKRIELAAAIRSLKDQFADAEISVSMGSASYPEDARNPESLMAIADRRMYWHKREHQKSLTTQSAPPSSESLPASTPSSTHDLEKTSSHVRIGAG